MKDFLYLLALRELLWGLYTVSVVSQLLGISFTKVEKIRCLALSGLNIKRPNDRGGRLSILYDQREVISYSTWRAANFWSKVIVYMHWHRKQLSITKIKTCMFYICFYFIVKTKVGFLWCTAVRGMGCIYVYVYISPKIRNEEIYSKIFSKMIESK
jgi:hypothetical protein